MKNLFLACIILLSLAGIAPAQEPSGDASSASAPLTVTADEYKQLMSRMEELGIESKDLEERYIGGGGKGKKKLAGVKLRHIPTGIVVEVSESNNQAINGFLARKELVKLIEQQKDPASGGAPIAAAMETAPQEKGGLESEEALSFDDEDIALELTEPTQVYQFPEVPTFFTIGLGYHTARVEKGSPAVSETEYEKLGDFATVSTELRAYPFPHRIHLDIDYLNPDEYFGDLRYSYSDLILFRYLNSTLFHNLDNINLIDYGPDPRYSVLQLDTNEEYGITTGIHTASLRFKWPDFPFHLYAIGDMVTKEGTRQQGFLGGSGYFNNLQRRTEKRKVDWTDSGATIGFNTHAGPIEVDYSYNQKQFEVNSVRTLYDPYAAGAGRPAGTYAHNEVPDFVSSTHSLKLHSSYTGRLVLSGTLAQTSTENDTNGAKADYLFIGAETVWLPMNELTFFVRYRHKDRDVENPSTAALVDYTDPSNPIITQTYSVRDSLSSTSDRISAKARVRPAKGVILNAEYAFENISRTNSDEWKMASETIKNFGGLKLRVRASERLLINAGISHEITEAPSHNTELDYLSKGNISATWTPNPRIMTYLGYDISIGKRDEVAYVLNDVQYTVEDREVRNNKVVALIGVSLSDTVSLTTHYSFFDTKVDQTLVYDDFSSLQPFLSDTSSPYKQRAHVLSADIHYRPGRFSLGAGVTHTRSRTKFTPSLAEALQPVSINTFSELETRETVYALMGEYSFRGGFTFEVEYKYADFDDVLDKPDDYTEDTYSHVGLAKLSKRW